MMTRPKSSRPRGRTTPWSIARKGMLLLLLTILLLVVHSGLRLPGFLQIWILQQVNSGELVVEAGTMRLDWMEGLIARQVTIYRKGVIGPALLTAGEVTVGIRPLQGGNPTGWGVPRVQVRHGRIDPWLLAALQSAPAGQAAGGATSLPSPEGHCRMELSACDSMGVWVEHLLADLDWDGPRLEIRNLKGVLGRSQAAGGLQGEVTYDHAARRLAGKLESAFDPHLLIPWFDRAGIDHREWLDEFVFGSNLPKGKIEFEWLGGKAARSRWQGTLQGRALQYRGVALERADLGIDYIESETNHMLTIHPFYVAREEGHAAGRAVFDLRRDQVDFDLITTLDPHATARMIGPAADAVLAPIRCDRILEGRAQGRVGYARPAESRVDGSFHGRGIGWTDRPEFRADEMAFQLHVQGCTNEFREIRGTLWGGTVQGELTITLSEGTNPSAYRASAELKEGRFQDLVRIMGSAASRTNRYEGVLAGRMAIAGRFAPNALTGMRGTGSIDVRNGHLFRISLFGGLTDSLARWIPGVESLLRQTEAHADFRIADRRIHSERILIEGGVLNLDGRGSCGFDRTLDYDVQVRLLKEESRVGMILRLLTNPLSKLFEFHLQGTLDRPKWFPLQFTPGSGGTGGEERAGDGAGQETP